MTASNPTPAYERLAQILNDERDMKALLLSPKDIFNEAQRLSFGKLVRYFEISVQKDDVAEDESINGDPADPDITLSDDDDDDDDDDEGRTSRRKTPRPRTKPSGSRSPWARFLKMESFSLSQYIQRYLEQHGTDPLPFFDDRKVSPQQMLQLRGHDRFVAAFRFVQALSGQRSERRCRWFFVMLMFFDLLKLIFPKARRVGKLMKAEIVEYFGPLVGKVLPEAQELRTELNTWCIIGSKVNLLCSEFGPGCLFFLDGDGLLSVDFLSTRKFGMKSPYTTEAFAHFKQTGLQQKVARSKANELATNIRSLLIDPFKESHRRRSSAGQ